MPSTGATFYDEGAVFEHYTAHRGTGPRSPNHVMEEPTFLRLLGDVDGRRVLDLGCGDAGIGRHVLAAGARSYLGIDASAKMVDAATAAPGGRLVVSVVHPVITAHDPRPAEDRRRTTWEIDDDFVRGPRRP